MAIRLPASLLRNILRFTLRPFLGPPFGFGVQRAWSRLASNVNPRDRNAATEKLELGARPALHTWPKGREPENVTLYLHGGGYCFGSWQTHQSLITHLAVASESQVYAPNYRLAPEHPHPAALEDALQAYRSLLAQGISSQRIALAGDSAGGGLALATALAIRDAALPAPTSLVLISPWTDLRGEAPSMTERASADPMLRPSGARQCAAAYLAGRDPGDPACSPLLADLRGLPPVLIQVGSDEILFDDSTRLAERLAEAGVDVTLKVFQGLWHEFQIHAGILEEADEAIAEIGEFLGGRFAGRGSRSASTDAER